MGPINWDAVIDRHAALRPATLSENALTVLRRRYLLKDADGRPAEEPADMFRRVAENIAQAEARFLDSRAGPPPSPTLSAPCVRKPGWRR